MLKFLFGGVKVRGRMGRKISDLEAKLTPVNGYTGRGEIEFSSWANGSKELEVELRGVAGRTADIYCNGERVTSVTLNNGSVDAYFDTRHGDPVPELSEGASVEVRQNGDAILNGVLLRD